MVRGGRFVPVFVSMETVDNGVETDRAHERARSRRKAQKQGKDRVKRLRKKRQRRHA